MAQVFISYAHADGEFAENIQHRLNKAGFEVWIDEERLRAGEDWREEIDSAILRSFCLVLLVSPASLASQYVMYEWAFAWGAKKKIVPVLFQELSNEMVIHPRLDKRQYLDFTHRNARPWDRLFQRLREISDVPSQTTVSPPVKRADESKIDPKVARLLAEMEDENYEIRFAAIKLLNQIKSELIPTDKIVDVLRANDFINITKVAAEILGNKGDSSCVIDLLIMLDTTYDTDLKLAIIFALGKIGDPTAISLLSDGLWSSIAEISFECREALKKIGTQEALNAVKDWEATPPPSEQPSVDIPF